MFENLHTIYIRTVTRRITMNIILFFTIVFFSTYGALSLGEQLGDIISNVIAKKTKQKNLNSMAT